MTEQEKREKAIKEMIEIAFPTYRTELDVIAIQRLYDYIIRKEEEVRKETAKRFLKMLYDMGVDRQTVETCGFYDVNGSALARFVSQEFGVEVEE